jgi:hypothetical protein
LEEALTGMIKGYLPRHRSFASNPTTKSLYMDDPIPSEPTHRAATLPFSFNALASPADLDFTLFTHHNQQEQAFPFSWNSNSVDHLAERQTILEFVDQQHAQMIASSFQQKQKHGSVHAKQVPTDWVDYVDRIMLQENLHHVDGSFHQDNQQQPA